MITRSYRYFESGDFGNAQRMLEQAHAQDFENREIQGALRACGFWARRVEGLEKLPPGGTKGDELRRQWKAFEGRYPQNFDHPFEGGVAALRSWVYTSALDSYLRQSETDAEALFQAGRCHKVLGGYEQAISTIEMAIREAGKQEARSLAELADVYALVGETRAAKVLMREALFLNAPEVECEELASPLFRRLIQRLEQELDENDPGFAEWLPVYGTLWGVFDVKRELSAVEFGKLKQRIYALKSEIADGDAERRLKPRLINHYFRMIDHYQSASADRSAIEEVLMEIKLLSPGIYRKYFE
ncbi:MAG: hypothetical protein MI717_15085 [Spirochaetales bacterium]|nr:hypothetical protein [Spirochaetales bacterium]